MASHFSSIGFPLSQPEHFQVLSDALSEQGEAYACPFGRYVRWAGASGAELWFQYDHHGGLLDIQPHFAAMAALRLGITTRLPRPTDTKLDGAWQGWLDPPDEDSSTGRCLVTFEAPDFTLHQDVHLPVITAVQMAAFAHSLTCYESEESFLKDAAVAGKLNAQSFVPATQRKRDRGETEPLQAQALVCGYLLRCELLHNEMTGVPFYWLLLETEGGRLDLLVDPEIMTSEPREGGIVMTVCWLSGRLLA